MKLIVNSDESLQRAIGELREAYKSRKFVTVGITHGKGRSLDQNALAAVWYAQVANELRDNSPDQVKAECKLWFGVPILRRDDDEFRGKYDARVRPLDYETKLALMEWFPVTRLMTTPQLSEYLGKVQQHYRDKGVWLEFPEVRSAKSP